MSQPVEFSTTVLCTSVSTEPSEARFRLDETSVTVDGLELQETAELDEIFDVRLGRPSQAARGVFSGPVLTVGFERNDQRAVLFVDGPKSTLEQIGGLLFRRLLDSTEIAVSHPTTIGGRVTDRQTEIGELRVTPGKMGCTGIRVPCNVGLGSIIDIGRSETDLLDQQVSTVDLEYVKQGVVVGVELSLNSPRKLSKKEVKSDTLEQATTENGTVLGVDLNVNTFAVTSTGTFWDGDEFDHWRREYEKRRGDLLAPVEAHP